MIGLVAARKMVCPAEVASSDPSCSDVLGCVAEMDDALANSARRPDKLASGTGGDWPRLRRRMDAVLDAWPVKAERGARHIAGEKLYLPALAGPVRLLRPPVRVVGSRQVTQGSPVPGCGVTDGDWPPDGDGGA